MPTPARPLEHPRPPRHPRLPVLLPLLLVLLGACSLLPPALVPADPTVPVVALERSGGRCVEGLCTWSAQIFPDGRVVRSDGEAQTVDASSLRRLVTAVDAADWGAILAVPFDGQCPTAFDGQKEVYTFAVGGRSVVVDSCVTLVDHDREPFRSVQGILFGLGG